MKRSMMCLLLAAVLLSGCQNSVAETTVPTTVPKESTVPTTAPTTEPASVPTEDPADSIRVGYYLLSGYTSDDYSVDGISSAMFRTYLQIKPDRTGVLCSNGVMEHVEWANTYLTIDGSACKFTIEDDVMTLNYFYQAELTLTYCGETLPEYYQNAPLEPGMYLLTNLVINGEGYYVENPSITTGYLQLNSDYTGVYFNGSTKYDFTWNNNTFLIGSHPMAHSFYSGDQTEDGRAMLILYEMVGNYEIMIFRKQDTDVFTDF